MPNSNDLPTAGGNSVSVVVDDPFYVSPNETTNVTLVTELLVGTKNYASWKKSMELALSGRSKLSFVRGEVLKPAATEPVQLAKWQRCNDIAMTWLISSVTKGIAGGILHAKDAAMAWRTLNKRYTTSHKSRTVALRKEIYTLMQGEMTASSFLEKLISLWDELDALLVEDVDYRMSGKAKEQEHVMSFLMGLNEKHSQIRTQILAMRDFPSLDDAHNMVAQDELQMELTSNKTEIGTTEMSAFYAAENQPSGGSVASGRNKNAGYTRDEPNATKGPL